MENVDRFLHRELAPGRMLIFDKAHQSTLLCRASTVADIDFVQLCTDESALPRQEQAGPFDSRTPFSTLVLNVTDGCNLRCAYCSRYRTSYAGARMDTHTILTCLRKAAAQAAEIEESVVVQFHGGEPCLGLRQILAALEALPPRERLLLDLRIQTNGTLLDETVMTALKEHDIHVGISMDGPPSINGTYRRFADGTPVADAIERILHLVRAHLVRSHISCLCVLSTANVDRADEVFDYIISQGIDDLSILPLYPDYSACLSGCKSLIPRTSDMVAFSATLFDCWIARLRKGEVVSIPTFQVWVWNLLAGNAGYLMNNTCCGAGEGMVFIDHDGNIYPCGPFSYDKAMLMGNIHTLKLSDLEHSPIHTSFRDRCVSKLAGCGDCPLQGVCRGGCPANCYLKDGSIFTRDPFCDYWQGIISHVLSAICDDPTLCELIPEYSIRL